MRYTHVGPVAFLVTALLLVVVPASAQVYYMFPGAQTVADNEAAVGGAVGFADDLFRMVGYGRFNMNPKSDLGVEIVIDVNNSNGRFGAGADYKYFILPADESFPLDLAVQGGLGFETGNSFTNFNIPLGGILSKDLKTQGGTTIVPYGGLYMVISHFSSDFFDDTDVDLELRFGSSFQISNAGDLFVAIHIADEVAFFAGFKSTL